MDMSNDAVLYWYQTLTGIPLFPMDNEQRSVFNAGKEEWYWHEAKEMGDT